MEPIIFILLVIVAVILGIIALGYILTLLASICACGVASCYTCLGRRLPL